ncbi:CRPV-012 [Crowpox virus]|nr:CRPV-012 [Crowpox virus]
MKFIGMFNSELKDNTLYDLNMLLLALDNGVNPNDKYKGIPALRCA